MVKYVGRTPNNDASLVTAGWADTRHTALAVDDAYITASVAAYAASAPLKNPGYVDTQDALRAAKTDVDLADAQCVPLADVGEDSGVASLDGSLYILDEQLPPLVLSRPGFYAPATEVFLTSEQTLISTNAKTLKAATIEIADPGYDYCALPMAHIRGRSVGALGHSRRRGGDSSGRMTVLDADDKLFGGGRTDTSMALNTFPVVPTAAVGDFPFVTSGDLTLHLWLALLSGTGYVFSDEGFTFFALVIPAI